MPRITWTNFEQAYFAAWERWFCRMSAIFISVQIRDRLMMLRCHSCERLRDDTVLNWIYNLLVLSCDRFCACDALQVATPARRLLCNTAPALCLLFSEKVIGWQICNHKVLELSCCLRWRAIIWQAELCEFVIRGVDNVLQTVYIFCTDLVKVCKVLIRREALWRTTQENTNLPQYVWKHNHLNNIVKVGNSRRNEVKPREP